MKFLTKKDKVRLQQDDVLYVPQYKFNLISIHKVLVKGHSISFKDKEISSKLANSNDYFPLKRKHRLFFFRTQFPNDKSVSNLVKVDDSQQWHERLNDLNFTDVQNTILTISIALKTFARYVLRVKLRKYQFLKKLRLKVEVKSTKRLEKKFIDILGPLNPPSIHGFRYLLMIVDEYSKFKVVKFLRAPSEALEKFQEFIAEHGILKVPTCKH